MSAAPHSSHRRESFLDIARTLALVGMIGTHVTNALLADVHKHNDVYYAWRFATGLVAPLFLVLAGFLFGCASARRAAGDHTRGGRTSWSWVRTRRYLSYVALGYVLHWPVRDWLNWTSVSDSAWQRFIQVDVLQLLGVGLIALQLLRWLSRSIWAFWATCAVCSAGVACITPLVAAAPWTTLLPAPVASYVWQSTGALFPMFPWMSYILAGAALSGWQRVAHDLGNQRVVALAGAGGAFLSIGLAADAFGPPWLTSLDYWRTSPLLILVRLGVVLLVLASAAAVRSLPSSGARAVQVLAERSLLVYVLHVVLVYGSVYSMGLRRAFGATLGPFEVLAITVGLLLVCWLAAWIRDRADEWLRSLGLVSLAGRA